MHMVVDRQVVSSVTFSVTTNFKMRQHLLPIRAAQVAQLPQDGASARHKKVFSTSLKIMEEISGDCCYMRRAGPGLQKAIMPAATAGPVSCPLCDGSPTK